MTEYFFYHWVFMPCGSIVLITLAVALVFAIYGMIKAIYAEGLPNLWPYSPGPPPIPHPPAYLKDTLDGE